MLIPRSEGDYDFEGAAFDLAASEDRKLLGWVMNQFLYGEVTGIQCGHWLYRAPTLAAASFLAKQAGEELAHVRKILRILHVLRERPAPAHPVIRFLATGMMGGTWGEHVALEMALGEGLVLHAFYAMARTIPDPEIHRILAQALDEEERHVEFGERETRAWLARHPETRRLILAQAWIQAFALRKLKGAIRRRFGRRLSAPGGGTHPVVARFDGFYDHALACFERRLRELGLARGDEGWIEKIWTVGLMPVWKLRAWRARRGETRLTRSYLSDEWTLREMKDHDAQ